MRSPCFSLQHGFLFYFVEQKSLFWNQGVCYILRARLFCWIVFAIFSALGYLLLFVGIVFPILFASQNVKLVFLLLFSAPTYFCWVGFLAPTYFPIFPKCQVSFLAIFHVKKVKNTEHRKPILNLFFRLFCIKIPKPCCSCVRSCQ